MSVHLPAPKEIKDLLTGLLGRDVTLEPCPPLAPTPSRPATVAVYVDDSLQVSALCSVDLPFSAFAGASIGLAPVSQAEACVTAGSLDETLRENLYEVLNIVASLFNVGTARHLRLYDVHHIGLPLPMDIMARALTLGRREDMALHIAGYGDGKLAIVLT